MRVALVWRSAFRSCRSDALGTDRDDANSDVGGPHVSVSEPHTPVATPRGGRDDGHRAAAGETMMDILLEMADTFSDFAVPDDGSWSGAATDSNASGYGTSSYSTTRGQYLQRMLMAGGVSRGTRLLHVSHAATASRGELLVEAGMNPVRAPASTNLSPQACTSHPDGRTVIPSDALTALPPAPGLNSVAREVNADGPDVRRRGLRPAPDVDVRAQSAAGEAGELAHHVLDGASDSESNRRTTNARGWLADCWLHRGFECLQDCAVVCAQGKEEEGGALLRREHASPAVFQVRPSYGSRACACGTPV